MEVEDALRALGGAARWRVLRGHVSWRALTRAKRSRSVEHRKGLWTLVGTDRARVVAAQLGGVRSHATAAEHWGLALPPEDTPTVTLTVPANANRRSVPHYVRLSYRRLPAPEVVDGVTTPLRTVVDCLRDESLRVALSVGDSALRSGLVDHHELSAAITSLRGRGSAIARVRLGLLDARAANAFESSARAILIEAGVSDFELQVPISNQGQWIGRVDLADRRRRIVIECDGFETHGGRDAFTRDLVRFTLLVSAGWRPLRFTWEQVMFRPEWVLHRVMETIDLAEAGARSADRRRAQPRRAAA